VEANESNEVEKHSGDQPLKEGPQRRRLPMVRRQAPLHHRLEVKDVPRVEALQLMARRRPALSLHWAELSRVSRA
jgi:hypothetical protein